ncbi:CBS domain protein with a domain protein (DUF21) isoform X2 [Tasmannia lanceolata]
MSGLTIGLMSLSLVDLEVLVKAGLPEDRKNAAKILPVLKNQHLLLCTLLIANSMAMEALPIFLDALVPAWGAVLLSVTLILVFGEIIPQAVCSRYRLRIGARMVVFVRLLLLVFFPISYPISKLLDLLLGKEDFVLLRRAELKTYVDMHGNEAGNGGELTRDETNIITGALDLTTKTAKDAMTSISETFSLDINAKLDVDTIGLIMRKGHSRIPIYVGSPTNIIGLILVKDLISCRPEDETPIRKVTIRKSPRVPDCLPLYDILNEFQKGHSHMAVVVKHANDVGATMENVKDNGSMLEKRTNRNGKHKHAEKGEGTQLALDENLNIVTNGSSVLKERGVNECILDVTADSFPNYSLGEVIGIITMEDVMEELLQEDILDETDVYVDAYNRIRINMISPSTRRMLARSPAASVSYFQRRTPMASPLSSYHHTPILRSPISPYIQVLGPTPTLSSSPGKSLPNSPAGLTGPGHTSPASHRVSRKPYKKLQKLEET